MEERTRVDAQHLGLAATVGMIVLLLVAYRSVGAVLLSALPLASAGLAGLAAVAAVFGSVHGITLAFGFTLIGVAQDYPLHLLSHSRPNRKSREVARELWPTLATGVASTCIAYLDVRVLRRHGSAAARVLRSNGSRRRRACEPVRVAGDGGVPPRSRRLGDPRTPMGQDHSAAAAVMGLGRCGRRVRDRPRCRAAAVLGEQRHGSDAGAGRPAHSRS